ncbi:hypothetical protein HDU88_007944 [Geranomyces variabilis]|nr:hypothetical protein HDU88_007944 [Geranomyces variabilis]
MNADIIHIVSQYLSTDDKANMRQTCKLFSENIYWTSHERNVRANQACRNDAPGELILRLLSTPTPVTTVDPYYIDLLSVACRLGKLRVVQFLAKDTRIDAEERGRAFAMACVHKQEKVIEALLADKDFEFVMDKRADGRWLFHGTLFQVKLLLADERTRQYFEWEHAMKLAIDKGNEEISFFLLQMLVSEPSTYDVDDVMDYAASRLGLNVIRTMVMDYGVGPSAGDNAAIRAASQGGDVDFVKRLLDDPRVDPNVRALYGSALDQACRHDQADVLKLLLQDPRTDPAKDGNRAMILACEEGAIKAVKVLLSDPRVDPSQGALPFACLKGHRVIAEILLQDERVDPAADDNAAFIDACLGGQDDVALWLLQDPRVDPSAANNTAIQEVSKDGSARLLEALLKDPRVNPAANNNYAIRAARRKRREAVVALLLADERVDPEAEPLSDSDSDSSDD